MKNNSWIIGLVVVIAAIVVLSIWGFKKSGSQNTATQSQTSSSQSSSQSQTSEKYFSESASVMYFYQDTCSWCIKEKDVLNKLADEGYRVKPMNIGTNHQENQGYWQQYNISGTPAFIASNGDRLEGYHDYDSLKAWLDQHK